MPVFAEASFDTVETAIAAIARGEFVVVVDDTDRENEGDLIIAADAISPAQMAFLVRHSSGLVCVALPGERLDALELPLMVEANSESHQTAFTVSVDYRHGTSTGISAADRAATLNALADPASRPDDFARPGHLFPLRARAGGVLERPGHTEAALDLAVLAERRPAGVLCEIVNDDGSMARRPELFAFARAHGLPIVSIEQLIAWRRAQESMPAPQLLAETRLPTRHGEFRLHLYAFEGGEYPVMLAGEPTGEELLTRLHSECLTGDVLGSLRCDCGEQLDLALARIAREGRGALLYLTGHEGRGIGLAAKLRAYALQDGGLDTVEANRALGLPVDARDYRAAAAILGQLGVRSVQLLSNNPAKARALQEAGIAVQRQLAHEVPANPANQHYLATKRERLGHRLVLPVVVQGRA
ncbi:3,4-dihydroxy-2-butanone-4-phosphate synthase [Azotobacter chroococcum]|uniref:3,4-dihydroxy-2-butanone-4-phosphate synthase n=1 Tax=Azotobacter chroococcum TaxID=353 RepID=UPI001038D0E0|nr:3,4-dihydroxy-2-butanone-4-phosphate synthase [Azotobacter chroococcum]TBW09221.1 3,4-dihydroxy-2-butanone-4-phosphate synthase [Azotobacter chroococcum]